NSRNNNIPSIKRKNIHDAPVVKLGFSSPRFLSPVSSQRSLPDLNSGHHLQREGAPAASLHRHPRHRCPAADGSVIPFPPGRSRCPPPLRGPGNVAGLPSTTERDSSGRGRLKGASRWSGSGRRPAGCYG
uniref:Uncharacterized protein n=1 Tax=Aegilops tauschii subsp. strangulata TaxID=200361 RepID=A0A452XGH7_AEGTS